MDLAGFGFGSGLILAGFWLDLGWIRLDFGWIWLDLGWIRLDFGWIRLDLGWIRLDFGWIRLDLLWILVHHSSHSSRSSPGSPRRLQVESWKLQVRFVEAPRESPGRS